MTEHELYELEVLCNIILNPNENKWLASHKRELPMLWMMIGEIWGGDYNQHYIYLSDNNYTAENAFLCFVDLLSQQDLIYISSASDNRDYFVVLIPQNNQVFNFASFQVIANRPQFWETALIDRVYLNPSQLIAQNVIDSVKQDVIKHGGDYI